MTFQRLPTRFWAARMTVLSLISVLLLSVTAVAAVALRSGDGVALLVPAGLLLAWMWSVARGRFRAWGYLERAEDLVVTRGLLFTKMSVVPYGRMQFIDVTAGPIDRIFGLATVQLHTAAAATDARIPGLLRADAELLRDRLTAVGEARATGL